jgi:hypothetical protein
MKPNTVHTMFRGITAVQNSTPTLEPLARWLKTVPCPSVRDKKAKFITGEADQGPNISPNASLSHTQEEKKKERKEGIYP